VKKIKKIFSLFIVLVLFFSLFLIKTTFSSGNTARGNTSNGYHYLLEGVVVSGIPSSDLISKTSGNLFIGLEKVDSAYNLKYSEVYDSANSIPIFSKINLFYARFNEKSPLTFGDLKTMYAKLPQDDDFDREKMIAATNSAYFSGNVPLIISKKAEPEIKITYKKVSTGRSSSFIPIRHVVNTNKVDTYFLLNPYAEPHNERLNQFDFEYAYDINPVFANTIALRTKSESSNADFTGFYVDIPSVANDDYINLMGKSLEKFSQFVHSKGKLLIVENLDEDNYKLGKYADIIGIKYVDNPAFLGVVKKAYPNKPIFATIDGDFSKKSITKILENLSAYGIYPEFRRDTNTGDFLYYENQFQNDLDVINRYTKGIISENGLIFKGVFEKNGFKISKFESNSAILYFIRGNGVCSLVPEAGFTNFSKLEEGKAVSLKNGKLEVLVSSGTFIVGHKINSPISLLGIIPSSQRGRLQLLFQNFSLKKAATNIVISTNKGIVHEDNNSIYPLTLRNLYIPFQGGAVNIKLGNINVIRFVTKNARHLMQYTFYILIILLILLWVFAKKVVKYVQLGISVKTFLMLIIVGGIVLILLNSYFIRYSPRVFVSLLFGVFLLILSMYDTDFSAESFRWAILLFGLAISLNFFQYRTLMPHFFDGIVPFQRFDAILYIIPWLIILLFFSTYGGKKINKFEILIIILSLAGPIFIFNGVSSPLVLNLTIMNSYPLGIVILGGALLSAFHKKGLAPYAVLFVVIAGLYFGAIYASSIFYNNMVFEHSTLMKALFLKDMVFVIAPFYFIALLHHNIVKKNPKVSVNKFIVVLVFIIALAALFSLWSFDIHRILTAERIFAMPAYILIEFLLVTILIYPLNNEKGI
jgi:hypothetical protein